MIRNTKKAKGSLKPKALLKNPYFYIMLSAILGFIIVVIISEIKLFHSPYNNFLEHVPQFFHMIFYLLWGVFLWSYDVKADTGNTGVILNGLFYFFLITIIVSVTLFIKNQIKKKKEIKNHPVLYPPILHKRTSAILA